jgi:hypothetical protein
MESRRSLTVGRQNFGGREGPDLDFSVPVRNPGNSGDLLPVAVRTLTIKVVGLRFNRLRGV